MVADGHRQYSTAERRRKMDCRYCFVAVVPVASMGTSQEHHVTRRYDTISEGTIRALVDCFYLRVRRDLTLGPIFADAIAADAWPAHLQKMYAFWSSVMLTSGRYKGDPVGTPQDCWPRTADVRPMA